MTSGTTRLGLVALSNTSNVFWTSGTSGTGLTVPSNDPNFSTKVPSTAYDAPIGEYGVVLSYPGQTTDQHNLALSLPQFLTTPAVQNQLKVYGYTPL